MNIEHPTSNPKPPSRTRKVTWLMGALALLALGFVMVSAQQNSSPGLVKGFNVTRYHPTPNHRQIEFKLVGSEARQLAGPNRQFQITRPNFQAFQTNGAPLVRIESPECFFDENSRTLNSTETLSMQSGDGRFSLAGRGFRWQQDNKVLVISNDVRAVIYWTNNAPPLEITSRWFEFDAVSGRGVFHDNVRGENPDQVFTCATLTISGSLAATNREPLELIEADGGLEITRKIGIGFAKAERGTYRPSDERVEMIGGAEWKFDNYSGRAERMTAWLNTTNLEASGKVQMSLPRSSLGAAGGLLNSTNSSARATQTNLVTLFANQFRKRGEQLVAQGAVRISDGTNQLTCDYLEGKQATAADPTEFAFATGNVFVGRAGGGIYSDRADFTRVNNLVVFTGNPRLQQDEIRGAATRVLVNTLTREVTAEENVVVTFPITSGSSSLLDFLPNLATNRVATPASSNQFARITAENFRLDDNRAVFAGNITARQLPSDGSEPRLSCGILEIRLAANGKRAESLQARDNVVVENGRVGVITGPARATYTRLDAKTLTARTDVTTGELVDLTAAGGVDLVQAESRARGDQLVYTAANQVLKLQGQPSVKRPEGIYSSERELIWDNARQTVVGSDYRITVNPETLKQLEESKKLP
jgi:lipopolysaccharide export system protein LptA